MKNSQNWLRFFLVDWSNFVENLVEFGEKWIENGQNNIGWNAFRNWSNFVENLVEFGEK